MKKLKKPGDNISLKTKKNEQPIILDWLNSQTNLMDSIRYLIENEVKMNGVRNLQNYIPAERTLFAGAPARQQEEVMAAISRNEEMAVTVMTYPVEEKVVTSMDDVVDEDDIESWL